MRDLGLEFTVLEHGFDDQIAALQVGRRRGGLDQAQDFLLRVSRHAALVHAALGDLGGIRLALFGLLQAHILEHRGNAFAGLRVGNARAHHAGTQQADLAGLEAGHTCGAALTALDGVEIEEEGVDHGLGLLAGHEAGQCTALDAQGGLDVHLQAFDHAGHDGFGRGVQAARVLLDDRRGHHQHLRHGRVGRQATGDLVALGFPGVLGGGVGGNPGQGFRFHLGCGVVARGYEVVHQAQALGLSRTEGLAFHQVGLGTHQAQVACHLGHATGAGQQAQGHFGQAELGFLVVDGDAVVAHQRHFPAATQRRAVEQANDRFTQGFDGAEVALDALDLFEHPGRVTGSQAHHTLEVGPGEEGGFVGGQQDATDGVLVLHDLGGHFAHVVLPLQAHGVDRGVGFVEGDGGDAVYESVLDGFHGAMNLVAACAMNTGARGQFGMQARLTGARRWSQCPCRHPHTGWPGHSAAGGGAVRRSGCPESWRRWRPAGAPWRWRRR